MAVDRQTAFAKKFNEITGNKAGMPLTTKKAKVSTELATQGFNQRAFATQFKANIAKVNKAASSSADSALTAVEQQKFLQARAEEMQREAENQPWYKDVGNALLRPLDVISRPGYAAAGAIKGMSDAALEGEPLWSIGDDVLYGGWRGLSGQSKTGFGDAFQSQKDVLAGEGENTGFGNRLLRGVVNIGGSTLTTPAAAASNKLENDFGTDPVDVDLPGFLPKINVNPSTSVDRAVGLLGDLGTDPTTYIGGKAVTSASKAIKTRMGIDAADELVMKAAKAVDVANNAKPAQKAKLAAEADDLMNQVRAKYPDIQVSNKEFGTQYVKSGGPTGTAAYRQSVKFATDDAAREFGILDSPRDLEAARSVQRVRLIDDVNSGAITPDEFVDQYRKVSPSSAVIKKLDAGKATVDDVIASLTAFKPALSATTKNLARGNRAFVEEAAQEALSKIGFDIQGGGIAGKVIGTPRDIIPTLANKMTEEVKYSMLYKTQKNVKAFQENALSTGKKALSPAQIKAMRTEDQFFDVWAGSYQEHFRKTANRALTMEQRVTMATRQADKVVAQAVEGELIKAHGVFTDALMDTVNRVPNITLWGKEVKAFPKLGDKGREIGGQFNDSKFGEAFNKAFKYSSSFPGYTTLLGNKANSLGIREYENFKTVVTDKIKELGITPSEAKELQKIMESGAPATGKIAAARDFLKQEYDEMYAREVAAGVRKPNKSIKINDYAYAHVYAKRSRKEIDKITKLRHETAQATQKLDGATAAEMRKAGHRVEEDAFMNLLYRKMKSQRQLTKAYFYRDLVTHYGIKGDNLTAAELKKRDLVAVPKEKKEFILDDMKEVLEDGENIYMDRKMAEVYTNFAQLQHNSDEIIRAFDFVTRKFKTWNTIYFPGYHVRNMIGDMFMGLLDGVKTSDYAKVMKNYPIRDKATIAVGGETTSYARLYESFMSNLSSGTYVDADLGGAVNINKYRPSKVIRTLSEGREDFGRFVHFYRAMDDEYGSLLKKGVEKNAAWETAVTTAMARVNHFKFDYRALTPTEMKYIKRGIPFYTFTRKAVPTLLESLMLQPKYLVQIKKAQERLSDKYETTQLPDWMREMGYMKIGENLGMGNDLLPSAVIEKAFTQNPVSNVNPIIGVPFELQTGKDLFTGKPVNSVQEALMNKWRGFNLWNPTDKEGQLERDDPTMQKILRLAGLPVTVIDDAQSNQAFAEIRSKIMDKLYSLNNKLDKRGYSVYMSERSDGTSLRIKDKVSGRVIWEGQSIQEAQEAAEGL